DEGVCGRFEGVVDDGKDIWISQHVSWYSKSFTAIRMVKEVRMIWKWAVKTKCIYFDLPSLNSFPLEFSAAIDMFSKSTMSPASLRLSRSCAVPFPAAALVRNVSR